MPGKRRQFSREFKEEAVRLWAESGRPLAQIARELTVRTEQLRRWRRQLGAVKADRAAAQETEAQELRRLRRELEITRQERDCKNTCSRLPAPCSLNGVLTPCPPLHVVERGDEGDDGDSSSGGVGD